MPTPFLDGGRDFIFPHPVDEELHDVLRGGRRLGVLPLHDGDELRHDLALLVPREQVGHQPGRGQDVVDVLEEALLLDVLVGEQERSALALDAAGAVQNLMKKIVKNVFFAFFFLLF